jgi:hypothetical protein
MDFAVGLRAEIVCLLGLIFAIEIQKLGPYPGKWLGREQRQLGLLEPMYTVQNQNEISLSIASVIKGHTFSNPSKISV